MRGINKQAMLDLIIEAKRNEPEDVRFSDWLAEYLADRLSTLTPPNEPLTPYPDGDTSIIACPHCGSGEYLHNEDGNEQNYCGQCGQAIDWSRPPEVSP
jgi:ribosomal protein S27AE